MKIVSLIILMLVGVIGFGQNVSFKATAPSVVELGEQFRLTYSIDKQGTNLQVPTLEGFDLLMGPSTSSSSSFSSINGQVTQTSSFMYTYVLEAIKEGTFSVPAATITVDGKQYKSNALKIQVVKGGGGNSVSRNQQRGNQQPSETSAAVTDENLFVRIEVSRRSLYMGESLVASIKVYSKVNLSGFGRSKFPSFSGFLAEEMSIGERIEMVRETYDGKIYNVGTVRKVLLFPQHTGEITIEPFELECIVREQLTNSRNMFDDFFGNYRDIKAMRKSQPVKITVKELPSGGKPLGFTGTVGNISMATSVSADTVNANDALTYKVVFRGSGNMKLIEAPKVSFPPDFEVYDPKINKDITTGADGMSGTVTFEYVVIPRYSGDYQIPAVIFPFFDSQTNTYKTLSGNAYNVHVRKGSPRGESTGETAVQSFKKEDVRVLGEDIRYIKTGDLGLHERGIRLFGTTVYLFALLVPFILFVIGAILNRRRIKANSDLVRVKNKAANKMAGKRMKLAVGAMKNHNGELFYDEVLKALWGYVSYKLNIDRAELNRDNISDLLQKKTVDNSLILEFIAVLDTCEYARYAPGSNSDHEMDKVYRDGVDIITKLDKAIK